MLTLFGILFIMAGIWSYVAMSRNKAAVKENEETKENPYPTNHSMWPTLGTFWVWLAVGVFTITLNGAFFWANAGTAYAVQYPWGGDKMVSTQGLKAKWWGRTIPLSYEISIQDVILRKRADGEVDRLSESTDGIYNRRANRWEFSDAIKADIATAVIVGVSVDDEVTFLSMADKNRSEGKLITGRVLPNIDAALKNTCKLMDAQEYISGKASDFDRYFRDQLENGMYLVEEYTERETAPQIIGDTATIRTITTSTARTNKQTKYRIKRDNQGNILRDNNSNSLTQYGIKIYQAQVTGIDWEASFDKRLDLQKDEVAKTQLEKQEAERQYYTAKKEIAAGEAAKAKERAILEKQQIKLTIAAETEAKVAEQNVIVERRQLEVEKLKAQSKKVAADATYYENAKRVQAGLTPQERAELELAKADVISKNIAGPTGLKLPSTVIGNTGKNNEASLLESLIGAELAKGMMTGKQ